MFYLITNSDGTKEGPLTDDPTGTLSIGQTVSVLSDGEYAAYAATRAANAAKQQVLIECQQARAKRYEAEASVYDLADAETKLASTDAGVQADGAAQKSAVLSKRLQIKRDIPKP